MEKNISLYLLLHCPAYEASFYDITVILKLIARLSTWSYFSARNINFVTHLFRSDGSVKNWNILKTVYALKNKGHFCWLQLNTIPEIWKKSVKQTSENTSFPVVKDHHLLRGFKDYRARKNKSQRIIFIVNFSNSSSACFIKTFW